MNQSSSPTKTPNDHHHHLSSQPSLQSLPSLNPRYQTQTLLLPSLLTTLHSHSSFVSALAADSNSLFSGSSDHLIKLCPLPIPPTPPSVPTVASTESPIKSLLLLSGTTLFSSHQDGKVRVWTVNKHGKGSPELHRIKLRAVLPTAKDRILGLLSPAKYVKVRRHNKSTWVRHVDAVSALAVSGDDGEDDRLLYSVSWDRSVKVWRTSDFRCMESISDAHRDAINAVVVSGDGFVYTGAADAKIHVWRRRYQEQAKGKCKHELVQVLERHRSSVNTLALSSDGTVLYSGACDRSVVVWERDRGRMEAVGALRGHKKAILCLGVEGELVCSGSADTTVRVWRRDEGNERMYCCLAVLEGHKGPVKSLAMARISVSDEDNSCVFVFSGGLDNDIKVWRLLEQGVES